MIKMQKIRAREKLKKLINFHRRLKFTSKLARTIDDFVVNFNCRVMLAVVDGLHFSQLAILNQVSFITESQSEKHSRLLKIRKITKWNYFSLAFLIFSKQN